MRPALERFASSSAGPMTDQHSSEIHLRTVYFSIPILGHDLSAKYSALSPAPAN